MKKVLVVMLVAVALGIGAAPAWRAVSRWRQRAAAKERVERMLRSMEKGDEQQAISAWAQDKIVLQWDELNLAQPQFEAFWRRSGLVTRSGWSVAELRSRPATDAVVVEVRAGGEKVWLLVHPGVPITVDEGA